MNLQQICYQCDYGDREKLKDRDYRIGKYIDVLELCRISTGAR